MPRAQKKRRVRPDAENTEGDASAAEEASDSTSSLPAAVLHRPRTAHGTFLRLITINDTYKLDNYPSVATAVLGARRAAKELNLDCVVASSMNGDFLSPCLLTSLDGGRAMIEGLNAARIDYACLGNHEFDIGFDGLMQSLAHFRGVVVNSNADNPELASLPRRAVLDIGDRTAVIGGFLTNDMHIYSPSCLPTLRPVVPAALEAWEDAKRDLGRTPDMFLPLTHQRCLDDKKLGSALSKHAECGAVTPVMPGGHDHEVYIEEAGGSLLVKVGCDVENVGVVDVWWTESGQIQRSCTIVPATEFEPEADAAEFVRKKREFLEQMMDCPIATLAKPASSKRVRFEESAVATMLLQLVKRGQRRDGVEVAVIQGGAVRANADYDAGTFTLGDLYREFAFATHQAVISVPGHVLAESVRNSRSGPKPAPNFLHLDADCEVEPDGHRLTRVDGKPLDEGKEYKVSIYLSLLNGLNAIEPLLSHVKEHVRVPSIEGCLPAKEIVLDTCMKDAWRQLIGFNFEEWDADADGQLSRDEIASGVRATLEKMDRDGDGFVDPGELEAYLREKHEAPNATLIAQMVRTLDTNGDGKVSASELASLAH